MSDQKLLLLMAALLFLAQLFLGPSASIGITTIVLACAAVICGKLDDLLKKENHDR